MRRLPLGPTIGAALACAILLYGVLTGYSTPLEGIAFITGVVAVYLAAIEHIANWPIGIVSSVLYSVVLLGQSKLLADGWLQVMYVILGIWGWYWWLHGGERRTQAKIRRTPWIEWAILAVLSAAGTAALTGVLEQKKDAAPFLDALTTVVSLAAQYMLTRKYIENWVVWIAVDVIYVYLYINTKLYLTAILYASFIVIAVLGWKEWQRLRVQQEAPLGPSN